MLILIRQYIESEWSAWDKDVFDAYVFGACGEADYSATSTSIEGPRTSGATKTLWIYSAQRTNLRTSSTPKTLPSSTKSIQSSKASVAAAPCLRVSLPKPNLNQVQVSRQVPKQYCRLSFSWYNNHCGHTLPSRKTSKAQTHQCEISCVASSGGQAGGCLR